VGVMVSFPPNYHIFKMQFSILERHCLLVVRGVHPGEPAERHRIGKENYRYPSNASTRLESTQNERRWVGTGDRQGYHDGPQNFV